MACVCVCSPAIVAELNDWVGLGGGNSGCCGDRNHTFGFHLPGCAVSPKDYSRDHEVPAPYNMNWGCAGDFSHGGNTGLRARHATLLARLMADDSTLSMICEFIGQPWADQPVKYWARWNGVRTLRNYTGAGHTTWSHISWYRSKANMRAYLWAPRTPVPPAPDGGNDVDDLERAWLKNAHEYARAVGLWLDETADTISDASAATPDKKAPNVFKQEFGKLQTEVGEISTEVGAIKEMVTQLLEARDEGRG